MTLVYNVLIAFASLCLLMCLSECKKAEGIKQTSRLSSSCGNLWTSMNTSSAQGQTHKKSEKAKVKKIKDSLRNPSNTNKPGLRKIFRELVNVTDVSVVTPDLGCALINVLSDILQFDNATSFTNRILNIAEAVGNKVVGYNGSWSVVMPNITISVVDIVPSQFDNLSFEVLFGGGATMPQIFTNREASHNMLASISLPSILRDSFPPVGPNQSQPRIQFQFYEIPTLFQSKQKDQILNTFVISASVTNASSPIKNLDEEIRIMFRHLTPNTLHKDLQCVFWNFNKNNGSGGWDNHGCRVYDSNSTHVTCLCDHLTHFGVLLDVSRTPVDPYNEQILTIITYIGCGVSSLFLGVTLLTYTVFKKLHQDHPSQILINLCLALLGLNLVFLANSWLSSWDMYGLCVAAAFTLHYFLLAAFTWMGIEAFNMYFAIVKVFNIYVPLYILKACAVGWGLPLIICITVISVNIDAYGSHLYAGAQHGLNLIDNSSHFCWLQDNVVFYTSVVAYTLMVLLFNVAIFVTVLIELRRVRLNSPPGTHSKLKQDLKGVASLTLLLGLTWIAGFFTWGPARVVLLYLFTGFNSLQGFFIFLFHCVMKEKVRHQWRTHLCFGRFRLKESSDWSNSDNPTLKSPRDSVPSSSKESTSASSASSQ